MSVSIDGALEDLSRRTCGTCGEPFDDGDDAVAVASGEVEGGAMSPEGMDLHHVSCAKVSDRRPPEHHLHRTERTGVVHVLERGGIGWRTLCGTVEVTADRRSLDTVRADDPASEFEDFCETCERLVLKRAVE